ncbi:hypothetical protein EOPP23_08750 [Endozoicomonas sp. OPT23]|uniref:hypothetical protein n=1 Tax=Endozoicomonas sp. OPT23 TaxID=2072845 RepID=UPI00129BB71D|nr:hypothetical protein [Endozoicomonas sp. OPT23]MRI33071.1 hypothetical protein [Endozoicomonas sp. OPT23]
MTSTKRPCYRVLTFLFLLNIVFLPSAAIANPELSRPFLSFTEESSSSLPIKETISLTSDQQLFTYELPKFSKTKKEMFYQSIHSARKQLISDEGHIAKFMDYLWQQFPTFNEEPEEAKRPVQLCMSQPLAYQFIEQSKDLYEQVTTSFDQGCMDKGSITYTLTLDRDVADHRQARCFTMPYLDRDLLIHHWENNVTLGDAGTYTVTVHAYMKNGDLLESLQAHMDGTLVCKSWSQSSFNGLLRDD